MIQLNDFVRELIVNGGFPVKHLSFSSIKEYLGNPRSFLKKYIRYEFDDQTKGVFMIGKSTHKALEVYFNYYKKGEMIPVELQEDGSISAHSVGLRHFERELEEARGKAITKWIQSNFDDKFAYPIFTRNYKDQEIRDLYDDVKKEATKYIVIPPEIQALGDPEKEIEYVDQYLSANVENALITLGADQTLEEMIEDAKYKIMSSIDNFFSFDWIPEGEVHSTEKEELVFFEDETGEEMPIPIKVVIDRVDIVKNEESVDGTASGIIDKSYSIVTDYKTVDKFSLTDADKADYEMQAGANYFAALVATWVKPKRMDFVEILKKAPGYQYAFDEEWVVTPCSYKYDLIALAVKHDIELDKKRIRLYLPDNKDQKLLKADLEKLITDNPEKVIIEKEKPTVEEMQNALFDAGILVEELGVTNTVEEMTNRLIKWGILVKSPAVNVFTLDFDERPDIVLTFLAMYKGIVNMIALCEISGTYLPNISAQWGGVEAWNDFKEFEGTPKTPNIKKVIAWEKLEAGDPVKVDHDVAKKVETPTVRQVEGGIEMDIDITDPKAREMVKSLVDNPEALDDLDGIDSL